MTATVDAICVQCKARVHAHRLAPCTNSGVIIFHTAGGPIEKATPCACDVRTEGRADDDTQIEFPR